MKKIVKGKIYDTETAELVAEYDNGYARNDFNFYWAGVYRKKNGEFFLNEEGGALSCMAKNYGKMTCGSEDINPLTEDTARNWLEKYATVETYLRFFPAEE